MFVSTYKHWQAKTHVPFDAAAKKAFNSFLEDVQELQEEFEYTSPQVGRELGKQPSKLRRWGTALWLLSMAIAKYDPSLGIEVTSEVGTRWLGQAELLLG